MGKHGKTYQLCGRRYTPEWIYVKGSKVIGHPYGGLRKWGVTQIIRFGLELSLKSTIQLFRVPSKVDLGVPS